MQLLNMAAKFRIFGIILLFGIVINPALAQVNLNNCIYQPEDKLHVEQKLTAFSTKCDMPIGDLIAEIGFSFLGTPYVAASLENGLEEKLVINLREMDCTTFVETCLALARTIKSGKTDFESFAAELEQIRYRDGIRNQYLSRMHYFSEWIHNNSKRKTINETPNLQGIKITKTISFMSTHPESYAVLRDHPELIPTLTNQEKQLSAADFYYFPKSEPENLLKALRHGDIIGLTSPADAAIDINHTGIIIQQCNGLYLLHASQTWKKVVLSEATIMDFLKPESKNSGIMIARPVF
jgi:hypothetical protein